MPKSKKHSSPMQNTIRCSLCKSESVIADPQSAELVCSRCGLVISDKIQEVKQESKSFHTGEPSRYIGGTGMSTSLAKPDMGLSTVISSASTDASGHEIEPFMSKD